MPPGTLATSSGFAWWNSGSYSRTSTSICCFAGLACTDADRPIRWRCASQSARASCASTPPCSHCSGARTPTAQGSRCPLHCKAHSTGVTRLGLLGAQRVLDVLQAVAQEVCVIVRSARPSDVWCLMYGMLLGSGGKHVQTQRPVACRFSTSRAAVVALTVRPSCSYQRQLFRERITAENLDHDTGALMVEKHHRHHGLWFVN